MAHPRAPCACHVCACHEVTNTYLCHCGRGGLTQASHRVFAVDTSAFPRPQQGWALGAGYLPALSVTTHGFDSTLTLADGLKSAVAPEGDTPNPDSCSQVGSTAEADDGCEPVATASASSPGAGEASSQAMEDASTHSADAGSSVEYPAGCPRSSHAGDSQELGSPAGPASGSQDPASIPVQKLGSSEGASVPKPATCGQTTQGPGSPPRCPSGTPNKLNALRKAFAGTAVSPAPLLTRISSLPTIPSAAFVGAPKKRPSSAYCPGPRSSRHQSLVASGLLDSQQQLAGEADALREMKQDLIRERKEKEEADSAPPHPPPHAPEAIYGPHFGETSWAAVVPSTKDYNLSLAVPVPFWNRSTVLGVFLGPGLLAAAALAALATGVRHGVRLAMSVPTLPVLPLAVRWGFRHPRAWESTPMRILRAGAGGLIRFGVLATEDQVVWGGYHTGSYSYVGPRTVVSLPCVAPLFLTAAAAFIAFRLWKWARPAKFSIDYYTQVDALLIRSERVVPPAPHRGLGPTGPISDFHGGQSWYTLQEWSFRSKIHVNTKDVCAKLGLDPEATCTEHGAALTLEDACRKFNLTIHRQPKFRTVLNVRYEAVREAHRCLRGVSSYDVAKDKARVLLSNLQALPRIPYEEGMKIEDDEVQWVALRAFRSRDAQMGGTSCFQGGTCNGLGGAGVRHIRL